MNELLYGHNPDENILAVHPAGENLLRVYRRQDGTVIHEDVEFFPFLYLSDLSYLEGFPKKHWVKKLNGSNFYQYLCIFTRWIHAWDAIHSILEKYNQTADKKIESYTETYILLFKVDPVSQYLMQSGRTLFKGMNFEDLYRIQLDIETYSKRRFSMAERSEDRIILIALSDNRGWEYVINGKEKSEPAMLQELVRILREKDPDVIEGHNIFNFDLPYILQRCEMHNIEFKVGRDGSAPKGFGSRASFAEREIEYTSYEINGRHIIDTWLLVQAYDLSKRNMESYGLKYAAQYFGFASPDRIYIKGEKISWCWDHEPGVLIRYALDDVRETRLLSEHLSPSTFYITQMVPFNYSQMARIGSATKIESLMLREYLRQKHSVPKPETRFQTTGGYTDIFFTGVLGPVLHVDVESLYPSIIINNNISPKTDELHIFNLLSRDLTKLRLDAKRRMKRETEPAKQSKYDAMQSSLKILINSFYGYLGYSRGLFNDYAQADRVTQTGQQLLKQLIEEIKTRGGKVVEVDTDGIYFVLPHEIRGEDTEVEFVEGLSMKMTKGINLALDGRFKKILSYKKKNYALLDYNNKITVKGSSLVSRSMERFARNFVHQCIDSLLNNNIEGLHQLYIDLHRNIAEHQLDVRDFAKTETLKDPLEAYKEELAAKQRNKSAAYELALSSSHRYRKGDHISYYIIGSDPNIRGFENCKLAEEWIPNAPDENTNYYLKRLEEYTKKFENFFTPQNFRKIFSTDDLFGFSAKNISIITQEMKGEREESEEEKFERLIPEPKIWLAEE